MASVIELSQYRKLKRVRSGKPAWPERSAAGPFARDADLVPVAVLLWLASVVRVTLGVVQAETFGPEASLALACCLGIPYWLCSR